MSLPIDNEDKGLQPFIREDAPQNKRRNLLPDPAPRQNSGGVSCALAGIVILLVTVMVGVALFLPPFSIGERFFGVPYTNLNAQTASTSKDSLTIALDPANPGKNFGVRLRSLDYQTAVGQKAAPANDAKWLTTARSTLPQSLTLLSPLYVIEKQGTAPNIKLSVAVPQGSDPTLIDLYRYDLKSERWQFVPSHPSDDKTQMVATLKDETGLPDRLGVFLSSRIVPILGALVDVGQSLKPEIVKLANTVYPAGLMPVPSGALQGVLPAGIEPGKGYGLIPTIRNYTTPTAIDVATVTTLLQNSGLRAVHIDRLLDFATSKPYQGLTIDYRRIPVEQRGNFTAFVTDLAQRLHNSNLTLTVVVPALEPDWSTGGYDWQSIGAVADNVQFTLPYDPQIFAENGYAQKALLWAVGEVNRAKLQILMSAQSVQEAEGSFTPIGYNDALAPLGQIALKPIGSAPAGTPIQAGFSGYKAQFGTLDTANTPSIKYFGQNGTLVGTMWLTTGAAFSKRLERIGAFNIAGVVISDLATTGVASDVSTVLANYKVNQPSEAPTPLSIKWTVTAGGEKLSEGNSEPGKFFEYRPDGNKQNIQFSAEIVGAKLTLGPVGIRVTKAEVAAPTVAPTIAPTATPIPTTATNATSEQSGASATVPTQAATPATIQPDAQGTPEETPEMMG